LIEAERPVNEVEKEVTSLNKPGGRESSGRALRKLREERNLSIAEVAQHLKYGVRQIEALEEDDFPNLPGMTFVRGMTRSYAKLLGGNPAELLNELEQRRLPDQVTVDLRTTQIPFPDGSKRVTRLYAYLSLLFVLVAAAIAYEWQYGGFLWVASDAPKIESHAVEAAKAVSTTIQSESDRENNLEKADAFRDTENGLGNVSSSTFSKEALHLDAAGVAVKAAIGVKRIALEFYRESWVEIKQSDGKTLMSQLNPQGSRQFIQGTPPFVLIIGNAPNVRLLYNEVPVDLRPYFKVDVARVVLE